MKLLLLTMDVDHQKEEEFNFNSINERSTTVEG